MLLSIVGSIAAAPFLFGQSNLSTERDQLQQLTSQLQQSPEDRALRERIIALALTLNPKPATPDAATMAEGAAEYAFTHAKADSDYSEAAKQYEKALLRAPWLAADYFNCGVAHEKAGEKQAAMRNFNLYLLAAPGADDAQAVKKRIGGLQYAENEENAPEGKAAKEYGPAQHQFAGLVQKLDGGVFVKDRFVSGAHFYDEVHFYKSGPYNLLMYHMREKMDVAIVPVGQDGHGAWEDKGEGYVMPTDGRDTFVFPPAGGQEFFLGGFVGKPSADGRIIEEINSYSRQQQVLGLWHRQ